MHILISLQPVTDKKEMVHFNAVSFVHKAMSPQLYRVLKNYGLIQPCHIKSPFKYSDSFWGIAKQFYDTGKDITPIMDGLYLDGLYLPEKRIITP
jgi:hypothetical protein